MGFEPFAQRRLRILRATTSDPTLRRELAAVLEEPGMSFVPSAELLRQVALCAQCEVEAPAAGRQGLCPTHRARWNLELCSAEASTEDRSGVLESIMEGVLASEAAGRQLLAALDRQLRALTLVWEAHERGAARLPDRVAQAVRDARRNVPSILDRTIAPAHLAAVTPAIVFAADSSPPVVETAVDLPPAFPLADSSSSPPFTSSPPLGWSEANAVALRSAARRACSSQSVRARTTV